MSDHHAAKPGQKTLTSYIIGLALSLIFTFTAFALVMKQAMPVEYLYITLTLLAVGQLIAQVIFLGWVSRAYNQ